MFKLNRIYNMDCMEAMKEIPDKYFELAIVDPPYGIDIANMNMGEGSSFETGRLKKSNWDIQPPKQEYFDELMRVSKNQVIWGGNYFNLPPTKCYLIWDKLDYNSDFASAELAWTSFDKVVKTFRHARNTKEKRIHPTQKPIKLYRWTLSNYATKGDKILDTHVGSGSSIIACIEEGYDYLGFEIDKEYYDGANKRIEDYKRQGKLF